MNLKRVDLDVRIGKRPFYKCGIYGCGKLGTTVAYALLQSGLFSELILSDPSRKRAVSEAAALAGSLPFCTPTDVYEGSEGELFDCDLIIFTLENVTDRTTVLSLLSEVARESQIRQSDAILINATRPMCEGTQVLHQAQGQESGRVFGIGGVAESMLLRQMVGRHLGVESRSVHIFLAGGKDEHLSPIWSRASVAGISPAQYCEMCGRGFDNSVFDGLFRSLQTANEKAQHSVYAAAEAICRVCRAIVYDENTVLSLTCPVFGHYGLENVSLCLPCVLGRGGVKHILELPLNEQEEQNLRQAAKSVCELC